MRPYDLSHDGSIPRIPLRYRRPKDPGDRAIEAIYDLHMRFHFTSCVWLTVRFPGGAIPESRSVYPSSRSFLSLIALALRVFRYPVLFALFSVSCRFPPCLLLYMLFVLHFVLSRLTTSL